MAGNNRIIACDALIEDDCAFGIGDLDIIQNNPVINNDCNSNVLACLPVGSGRREGAGVCNDSVCAQIGHIGELDISIGINRIQEVVISCEDNCDVVIIFDYVNGLRIRPVF